MSEQAQAMVTVWEYDRDGVGHPRWMDDDGTWHDGWGWTDERGIWQVQQGYLDADGTWFRTDPPVVGEPALDDEEPLPVIGRFDRQTLPFLGSSAAAHATFLLLAMMMPDAAGALDLDGYDAHDRFVQVALTEMQELEPPTPPGVGDDSAPQAEAAKHAGEEGQAGDPAETAQDKRLAIKGPQNNEDLQIAQARNQEIAMSAGIASQVSSIWATADQSVGRDALDALGQLDGDELGPAKGIFGMGVRGNGRGGGGHDGDSLGRHDVDTSGLSGVDRGCRGVSCGTGSGTGLNDWDKDTKVPPEVVPGPPKIIGTLDREIIQRIVREHRRELRFCYEQELQKNKELKGELMVKFTVGPTGSVIAAVTEQDNSTLKNGAVSSCVTGKIRRWVFPRSPGNEGLVMVRYPFRFSAGR